MSGVNCTRRNSTPTARGERVREQRLGDAGHAFEQQVTADARRGEHARRRRGPGRPRPCAPRARRGRAVRSPSGPLVGRRARRPGPSASTSSVIGRRMPQCHDLVVGETHARRGRGFDRRRVPRRRAARRASLDPVARPRAAAARARRRSQCVRSSVIASASTYSARAGGSVARRSIGRSEAAGARPREHDRRDAETERARPSTRRDRAEPAGLAVAVHAFGEHDRRAGRRPRARGRTRRCRLRRRGRSRAASVGEEDDLAAAVARAVGVPPRSARSPSLASAVRSRPAAYAAAASVADGARARRAISANVVVVADARRRRSVDPGDRSEIARGQVDEHGPAAERHERRDAVDVVRGEERVAVAADDDQRRAGIDVGLREIAAYPPDRMAVVGEQLRVRGQAVAAASRTTTRLRLPAGSRRPRGRAPTRPGCDDDDARDDDRDDRRSRRDRLRRRWRRRHRVAAPLRRRRAATRCARSATSGGSAVRPPYATRSKVPARSSKVSEPSARAHLGGRDRRPVVDRTAIAESQQSGAETQAHRRVRDRPARSAASASRSSAAGSSRAGRRDRRPFGCCAPAAAGCTRRTIHATTRPAMTRTMASHTYHGTKSIDVADPADRRDRGDRRASAAVRGTDAARDRCGSDDRRGCRARRARAASGSTACATRRITPASRQPPGSRRAGRSSSARRTPRADAQIEVQGDDRGGRERRRDRRRDCVRAHRLRDDVGRGAVARLDDPAEPGRESEAEHA